MMFIPFTYRHTLSCVNLQVAQPQNRRPSVLTGHHPRPDVSWTAEQTEAPQV